MVNRVGSQEPGFIHIWIGLVVTLAVALLLLRVASGGLREATAVSWKGGMRTLFERLDAFYQRINLGNVVIFQPRNGSPGRGNPVAWLARTSGGSSLPAHKARLALGMFGVVSVGVVLAVEDSDFDLSTLPGFAMVLAGLGLGATAVAGDRERKSLSVLLSTPLDGRTILAGKALSTARFLLVITLPPVLLYLIPLAFYDANLVVASVAGGLFWLGECVLAFSLAAACSLYLRSPLRAAVAGLFLLGVVHLLPPLALMSASSALDLAAPGALAAWGLSLVLLLACGLLAWRAWKQGRPVAGLAALIGVYLLTTGLILGVPAIGTWWAESIMQPMDFLLRGLGLGWIQADFYSLCVVAFPWLAVLALLVFSYSVRTFDRAVGRAP
jgi:ABC-type transport system involved in multi-copper enzyme maturation permease subunit